MNQLKHFREKAGISQKRLALAAGLATVGALQHYEAGRRMPPLDTARKLVAALNAAGAACSLDKVFPPQKSTKKRVA